MAQRVVLVDDHEDIRTMLRACLASVADFHVVGEAADGQEAVAIVAALRPDTVILDLEMPLMRGDQAIPLLRAAAPGIRIVLYSASVRGSGPHVLTSAPDAAVSKGRPLTDLVAALRGGPRSHSGMRTP